MRRTARGTTPSLASAEFLSLQGFYSRGCARRRACCSLSAEKKLSADRNERRWCAACYCLPVRSLFWLQCLET